MQVTCMVQRRVANEEAMWLVFTVNIAATKVTWRLDGYKATDGLMVLDPTSQSNWNPN